MKNSLYMLIVSSITFIFGVAITSHYITSGPGGTAKIKVGDSSLEIKINDVNFEKLFEDSRYRDEVKLKAKKLLELYEIDHSLIKRIEALAYDHEFSRELREIRDRMKGPFKAPDKKVTVAFSDRVDPDKAKVCPDSDFYKKRINVALEDLSNMIPIDNAALAIIHGCHPEEGKLETIVISEEKGRFLLRIQETERLPNTINAFAKEIPSYVVVMDN